MFSSLAAT